MQHRPVEERLERFDLEQRYRRINQIQKQTVRLRVNQIIGMGVRKTALVVQYPLVTGLAAMYHGDIGPPRLTEGIVTNEKIVGEFHDFFRFFFLGKIVLSMSSNLPLESRYPS